MPRLEGNKKVTRNLTHLCLLISDDSMPAAGDKGGDNRIAEGGMLKVYRKSREYAVLEARRRELKKVSDEQLSLKLQRTGYV